jgi:hypothetical protein
MGRKTLAFVILLCLGLLFTGCSSAPVITNILPPTPSGWDPKREGWIPPVPRGFDKPRPLETNEWEDVLSLTGTDPIVSKQNQNGNISEKKRYWIGYSGTTAYFYDTESRILSGKSHLPAEFTSYFPTIIFDYRNRVITPLQFDTSGRMVGVDINSHRIIFTFNLIILPDKAPSR